VSGRFVRWRVVIVMQTSDPDYAEASERKAILTSCSSFGRLRQAGWLQ
jgi:hypothetical protein